MEKVKEIILTGEIGDVVNVQGDFGWKNVDCPYPEDRIWNPQSGGMTLDIGMYMAQLGQVAYPNAQVLNIQAMATKKNGIDQTILTNIMYQKEMVPESDGKDETPEKGMLQFYVTGAANTEERVTIQGSDGRIVLDSPAHVPERVRLFKDEGRGKTSETVFDFPLPDDSYTSWNYPGSIGFTHEIKVGSMSFHFHKNDKDIVTHGIFLLDGKRECLKHFRTDKRNAVNSHGMIVFNLLQSLMKYFSRPEEIYLSQQKSMAKRKL